MTLPVTAYVVLAGVLFTLGALTVLLRRNALIELMGVELMLNAVNLVLAQRMKSKRTEETRKLSPAADAGYKQDSARFKPADFGNGTRLLCSLSSNSIFSCSAIVRCTQPLCGAPSLCFVAARGSAE